MVICGWTTVSLFITAAMPTEQFVENFAPYLPADQLARVHRLLWHLALSILVLGLLPGIAYIYLGFGVRKGRALPTRVAIGLAVMQTAVLAVLVLDAVVTAISGADPVAVTAAILLRGTPLAILIGCVRVLLRARLTQGDHVDLQVDPWR